MNLNRLNKCDGCHKILIDNESVTALIPNVVVTQYQQSTGTIRLKLSEDAISSRTLKIYCKKCLNIKKYQE